jgi:copper(I)-binding protein
MRARGLVALGAVAALVAAVLVRASGGSGRVELRDVRIPQPAAGATTAAVYATIRNGTGSEDRLVGLHADVGSGARLMEEVARGGAGFMTDVAAVTIPAGASVRLSPGVRHGMLDGVPALPATVHLTFVFERAGEISADAPVVRR